jgi:hypothetical protein
MIKKSVLIIIGLLLTGTLILAGCGGGSGLPKTTQYGDVKVTTSPDNKPFDDIPVYSGAKAVSGDFSALTGGMSSTGGMTVQWRYYQVSAGDVSKVQDFYKSAMPDKGWSSYDLGSLGVPSVQGMTYLMFMKDTTTSATIMTFANPANAKQVILAISRTSMK